MGGLSGIGGLGSLASGFQQGADFVQDFQYKRQRKKALDFMNNQLGREDAAAQANSEDISDEERAFYGDDTAAPFMPEVGDDPFLYRFVDMMQKRRGKKGKRKQALSGSEGETGAPVPEEMPEASAGVETIAYPDFDQGVTAGPAQYADGGKVDEEVKRRAAANRAKTSGSVMNATEKGPTVDRSSKMRSGVGKADRYRPVQKGQVGNRSVALRGAVAGAGALAGIQGAMQGMETPTEDYATRIGVDPSQVGLSFWKDAGIRTAGVLTDVGAAAGNMVGLDMRSRFADVQGRPQPAAAATPVQTPAEPPPRTQALQTSGAAAQPAARSIQAPSATPAQPQPGDAIDMSQIDIDASELPDIKMADWKRYRAQALRSARLKGLPQAQALEEADRLVTTMQIRGFSNYAAQAQALLGAGNVKGALRSLRAAYQYFPDGNDVKLGVHKGKIVAVGIDEETGQPFEGGTRVITPEFLAGAIQNFQNPQNFLAWTNDWRDEAFKHKQYEEVTKPLAEAQAQSMRTNAQANLAYRNALMNKAATGGGLKPSDMARSEAVYRERLALMGVTDPEQSDTLAAVMSQIKQANPTIPDNMIADFVMKAQARPDGQQFIQRALSGQ